LKRYLIDFEPDKLESEYHDVVIIGSGIAGVYTALEISEDIDVLIVTKETIDISNSVLAQGGIAVSLDKGDSPELHFKDTLYAGAGLCDQQAVWVLVNEAAKNIEKLCEFGVNFDKKGPDELALSREGAHSKNRIIHAGDTTGKEVLDKLISVVKTRDNIKIRERHYAIDLITIKDECRGLLVYDEDRQRYKILFSKLVVCATGGYGQLYAHTTNPEVATGDGVAISYRAGAELMDLEFVQFHPTILYHEKNKSFLISEAVRGEGAILRNIHGKRFMPDYHQLNELAPRDVVSRAIFEEMKKTRSDYVYLDITFKDRQYLETRFPNIFKTCLEYGIDISKDYIPVAPGEHYCMGGIKTDPEGRTNIKGFYACGEAACNGIHGANRLASNSLLEGLVFGSRIGNEITRLIFKQKSMPDNFYAGRFISDTIEMLQQEKEFIICKDLHKHVSNKKLDAEKMKKDLQEMMTLKVGIVRDGQGLQEAKQMVEQMEQSLDSIKCESMNEIELSNMVLLSKLVIESALERKESRGAHFRADYSSADDINWNRHIIKKRGDRIV